jgi:hypothetical protein
MPSYEAYAKVACTLSYQGVFEAESAVILAREMHVKTRRRLIAVRPEGSKQSLQYYEFRRVQPSKRGELTRHMSESILTLLSNHMTRTQCVATLPDDVLRAILRHTKELPGADLPLVRTLRREQRRRSEEITERRQQR